MKDILQALADSFMYKADKLEDEYLLVDRLRQASGELEDIIELIKEMEGK